MGKQLSASAPIEMHSKPLGHPLLSQGIPQVDVVAAGRLQHQLSGSGGIPTFCQHAPTWVGGVHAWQYCAAEPWHCR